jgi:hypothetical protein
VKIFSWIFTLSDHAENIPPPRGDVNNREKRAAVSATCSKIIGGRRLRGSKGQLEMGDNPVHGLMKGAEQPL